MTDDQKQALSATVEALGLTYAATFVPKSQSRNKAEQAPSLNWRISLSKGASKVETDYFQGIAHLPGYDQSVSRLAWYADALREMCEKGKSPRQAKHTYENCTSWAVSTWKAIPAPALLDVLYCLVLDASVLQSAGFEDWAQEFGYDTDSRQAEATYRACLESALKLQAMIGSAALENLRELFQDY